MELSPSAHTDTFCRDNLPPYDLWPELRFDLPELRYPNRLNCAQALLDVTIARYGADRPALRLIFRLTTLREQRCQAEYQGLSSPPD